MSAASGGQWHLGHWVPLGRKCKESQVQKLTDIYTRACILYLKVSFQEEQHLSNVPKAQQALELWTSAQPVLSHNLCWDNKDFLLLMAHTLPKGSLWAPNSSEPPHPELLYSPSSVCSPHNLLLVWLSRYFILAGVSSCSPASLLPRFPLSLFKGSVESCANRCTTPAQQQDVVNLQLPCAFHMDMLMDTLSARSRKCKCQSTGWASFMGV